MLFIFVIKLPCQFSTLNPSYTLQPSQEWEDRTTIIETTKQLYQILGVSHMNPLHQFSSIIFITLATSISFLAASIYVSFYPKSLITLSIIFHSLFDAQAQTLCQLIFPGFYPQ